VDFTLRAQPLKDKRGPLIKDGELLKIVRFSKQKKLNSHKWISLRVRVITPKTGRGALENRKIFKTKKLNSHEWISFGVLNPLKDKRGPLIWTPLVFISGGRGEIRTLGRFPYDGFQDRSDKPLWHPSMGYFTTRLKKAH
jgi:hypothetical protein